MFDMQVGHGVFDLLQTVSNVFSVLYTSVQGPFRIFAAALVLSSIAAPALSAQIPDLTQKSLEDLMNIEVTSVSKKEQKTSQAAAAIFVISRQDIRRSGALNIPDLLRMVPGLDVAQIDSGKWSISARGFNGQYSNKLLVLIDGRTVYNTIFAGVFWDSQIVPLDTIERIEVIRGPGAAVWGSNAVRGVINIITRNANDTQGGYIAGGAGNTVYGPAIIGYGGKAPVIGAYRVYVQGFQYNSMPTFAGLDGHDDWHLAHGGFRTDTTLSPKDSLITEGEVYHGNAGEIALTPLSISPPVTATLALRDLYSGWNVLARWNRTLSPRSDTSLQVYFDRTNRGDTTYDVSSNTFDVDFQNHIRASERQDIVWGLGYRGISNGSVPTLRISFTPQNRFLQLFSLFAQDEIALRPNRLHLSLGARLDHNDYTGFNFQPSARLAWSLDSKNTLWASVSEADRTPERSDTDLRVNYEALPGPGLPILVSIFGNPKQKDERLIAFEAGYRSTWASSFSLDATIFFNRDRDLLSVEPGATVVEQNPAPVHLLVPSTFGNGQYGEMHGIEVFANWKVSSFWTLSPGYSFLAAHLHASASSQDFTDPVETEGGSPHHQAQLRSSVSLPKSLQWNTSAYFVDRLSAVSIPSYTRLDSGLTWRAGEHFSISVEGQDLIKALHPEYAGPNSSLQSGLVRRGGYAKAMWSF